MNTSVVLAIKYNLGNDCVVIISFHGSVRKRQRERLYVVIFVAACRLTRLKIQHRSV